DHRMELNNWLQIHPSFGKVTWETSHTGPQHAPTWSATAYVGNIQYGNGSGPTQGAAKEQAAYEALMRLRSN
ncbi:hypothetical protein NEOLEDRAFT_1073484, partial [Neolentinus lepideus HHB14362 ss-1]